MRAALLWVAVSLSNCVTAGRPAASPPRTVPLPGATADGVAMDYLLYEPARDRVWVPAGNTGSVDVIDAATLQLTRVGGFATAELERGGKKRTVGPSSATVGDGVVYVGNRGDSSICAVDAATLTVGACVKLDSMPDGLQYVAATRELWVTAPRDRSIRVLDTAGGKLEQRAKLDFEGEPEGFAVDEARGRFFTNLEDKDLTLAIDLKTKKIVETWRPACGEDGPRGLALDRERDFLLVACTGGVTVLDAGHGGGVLSKLQTGEGVDNIDYLEARHQVFAAAGRAATLTVARLEPGGQLTPLAVVPTASGARNAVVTRQGVAFVSDTPEGKILVVAGPP